MTATTAFEGTNYLLGITVDGSEWVSRYTLGDMAEIFSEAELQELRETGKVHQFGKNGGIMWIDMIASARDAFRNA